jgi:hypothetical protein
VQAKALLALARPQEALAAAERACASPRSVPADMFVRICALATIGERDRAVTEFGQLRPAFAGTLPFKETATELRRLGIPIE